MLKSSLLPLVVPVLILASTLRGSAEEASPGGAADDVPNPSELHEKFEKMENPLLQMGDTGDRVRELQATLNLKLGGQVLELMHPIFVGPVMGPSSAAKNRQRLAYSSHRDVAFQIRGDWMPVKNEAGDPLDQTEGEYVKARFMHLPEAPLTVDGIFGQHTKAAVALFQHAQTIPISGEVDAVTLDKLEPLVPTNPLLAFLMSKVEVVFRENDNFPKLVKTVTALLATLLILIGAAVAYQIARGFTNSTHWLAKWLFTPESSPFFTAMLEQRVFRRGAQFAPAFFIYIAGRVIFPAADAPGNAFPYLQTFQDWHLFVSHLGLAYASLVMMLVGFAVANAIDSVVNPDRGTDNPIGSIIRASKRVIGFIGTLLIIASLVGKSPFLIMGGLGAFMAIFMVVFRDSLLGLVASIQIIGNKVVRIGDWISMPTYNADGVVQKISLTLIKVQNTDKTVSTIPTTAVLAAPFQNWTGMMKSGGRRIKRSIYVDLRTISICTPEMITRFGKIELLQDYLARKATELEEYNRSHQIKASPVNSRRLTNLGTFRAYLDEYLKHHPGLSPDMTMLVRHLQPTSTGLPLEIYAFCNTTEWTKYEAVQADIFDHVLAILPEFELRAFQDLSEINGMAAPVEHQPSAAQAARAEIESLVEASNAELADNPRKRLPPRLKTIKSRIEELALEDHFAVKGHGRHITLEHFNGH